MRIRRKTASDFNPRPPRGGRHRAIVRDHECRGFQSTPSARRATENCRWTAAGRCYFNPRPPRGGRLCDFGLVPVVFLFQSTPSARRATLRSWAFWFSYHDFNPRPPRGGRHSTQRLKLASSLFQSTPSARRATILYKRMDGKIMGFQSTPSARRATAAARRTCATVCISIHALREEGDSLPTSLALREGIFQSTPSARRATTPSGTARGRPFDFNPRPPRGGRPPTSCRSDRRSLFQSTPSARRATVRCKNLILGQQISIHALREEGDSKSGEKIHHVCSIIHTCAQFEKELYEGSGEMQNKSC